MRIHTGVGDGTFNATPVDVDVGFEKGNVAGGDADGDGDLDVLAAGTDGTNPQLSVYLDPVAHRIEHNAQRAGDVDGDVLV